LIFDTSSGRCRDQNGERIMGVASPELMAEAFIARFNERDGAGLLALYEPDAVFTFDGETKAVGTAEIKAALDGFLAGPMKLRGGYAHVFVAGDTALCRLKWEMIGTEGWIESDGVSAEVLKRGSDGLWRFKIDDAGGGSRG
jgi:uncharacterized protein (TIGR02246 family)